MPVQTTCTQARARLAALLDDVVNNRDIVIIQRRDGVAPSGVSRQ